MHVHANEDDLIMGELLKTYEVEARVEAKGSTLYHLLPRQ